jgi:hypothetical protein
MGDHCRVLEHPHAGRYAGPPVGGPELSQAQHRRLTGIGGGPEDPRDEVAPGHPKPSHEHRGRQFVGGDPDPLPQLAPRLAVCRRWDFVAACQRPKYQSQAASLIVKGVRVIENAVGEDRQRFPRGRQLSQYAQRPVQLAAGTRHRTADQSAAPDESHPFPERRLSLDDRMPLQPAPQQGPFLRRAPPVAGAVDERSDELLDDGTYPVTYRVMEHLVEPRYRYVRVLTRQPGKSQQVGERGPLVGVERADPHPADRPAGRQPFMHRPPQRLERRRQTPLTYHGAGSISAGSGDQAIRPPGRRY